jgi:hypothetical protein
VRLSAELEQRPHRRRDLVSLLIVEDVRYRPRWSWEIERVIEVPLDDLPAGVAPVAAEWITALRQHL